MKREVVNEGAKKSPRPAGMRILVVEDHPDTRLALEMFLQALGHRTESAGDIQQALRLAEANSDFDLLLSDIRLPDGDGWELLQRLEATGWRPPQAIAISGWSSKSDLAKSQRAGFRTHLIKPFAPDILETALIEVAKALEAG